ncbi:plasmid replication initiator TrfA [Paraburkholderia elongata]|uniref:TrfA protein n=1 Tax=Paraburkholderia elongata TaxID=2675747 RepID=A0A972NL49_9BURK|nr:plasmid replication initiator TrfA [Paraburkholderia elongata]NPT54594.1 hypothetical protein [Paraburkholderia elongata]
MSALQTELPTSWPELKLPHGLGKNFITAHTLARCAIFSTQAWSRLSPRPKYPERKQLATTETSGITVFQTAGEQLDQGDADVFHELLRRVFVEGGNTRGEHHVRFNRGEFLRALGRARGGTTGERLDASLNRLYEARFEFDVPGLFKGKSSLILNIYSRETDSTKDFDYDVLLDVSLARLFPKTQWTLLRRRERDKLIDPLAKGVHAYYSTHKAPYPMKAETLQNLMGRESMQPSKWRIALRTALEAVQKATGWTRCALEYAENTRTWMVFVEKGVTAKTSSEAAKQKVDAPADNAFADDPYDDI